MTKKLDTPIEYTLICADGVTAVVLDSFVGGKRSTGIGVAKLNPVDRFDPSVGDMLAYGRALRELGRKLIKEGYKKSQKLAQNG